MDKKLKYFDIEQTINDKRDIKGIILENGIKIVLLSDENLVSSACSIAVNVGYLQDKIEGTAHFLEHLLFMGSEKYKEQNEYHSYVQICGGQDNAFTTTDITCYYLNLETTFLKKGIEMLSWFFRAPLLDISHINSEREIINSEHEKNILSDNWIIDDIFKNFIKKSNKYLNFGTGNYETLKNITKEDIISFYNKYYTTDNIYVCIADSKNINTMISEYLDYFENIPIKLSDNLSFEKENLLLKKENFIIFKTSSEYKFLNYYLITNCNSKDEYELQLSFLIVYLIGSEFIDSLSYFLKEKEIVKEIYSTVEYFFDNEVGLLIQFMLIDSENLDDSINQINYSINQYLKLMLEITQNEFEQIYKNYQKIKLLKLMYNSNSNSVNICNEIVENMIKGDLKNCIVRNLLVPEFNYLCYIKFLDMIKNIIIKISTNINILNLNDDKFIKSKWYNSSFYLLDHNFNYDKNYIDFNFNLIKSIGIQDFKIKINYKNKNIDKKLLPSLIFENKSIERKIYLLEVNKYSMPLCNISVIRKNLNILDKKNKFILNIFILLCDRILNYYQETLSNYKMNFTIFMNEEYLIYNFSGLNYIITDYVSNIIKKIHPDNIFNNDKIEKNYNNTIRDIKDFIINQKYNSPYIICNLYFNAIKNNSLLFNEQIDFLNNLTFENFKNLLIENLKYSEEYYIYTGIYKYGIDFFNFDLNEDDYYDFNNDNYLTNLTEILSINPKKYLDKNIKYDFSIINEHKNYIIDKNYFNSEEINNCIIKSYDIKNLNFELINNKISEIDLNEIINYKLITVFISEILNEPLFDRIRTIDKLGYIVKCDNKIIMKNNHIIFMFYYLIQSTHDIKRIESSIKNFNKFIIKDIKNNYENYQEKFNILKKSKLLDLVKPFPNLFDEISSYIEVIVNKLDNFNINLLYLEQCEKLKFENIVDSILSILASNSFNIILKTNKNEQK